VILGELVEGVGCLGVFCDIWKGVIGVSVVFYCYF